MGASLNQSLMTQKELIEQQFLQKVGYFPDIDNPKTLNEKIQWLKLYYRNPLMTTCADKFKARDYIQKKIGKEYLIPLLGVYTDVSEFNFKDLPRRFVFKLNNASGKNIICKNKSKLNIKKTTVQLAQWLHPEYNHYFYSYEWAYKNIAPKIICEAYIEQKNKELSDYKFFCFHGRIQYFIVTTGKRGEKNFTVTYFDRNWQKIPCKGKHPASQKPLLPPQNFSRMIQLVEMLAAPFPFVRTDMYNVDGKIYAGELTFYPSNGMAPLKPFYWEYKQGKLLDLVSVIKKNISGYIRSKRKRKAKTVIYTAITQQYDNLLLHKHLSSEFDYVCFSDTLQQNFGVWEVRKMKQFANDPVRNARYYKLFPHKVLPEYETSVWIDANIDILDNTLENKVKKLTASKTDFAVNIHYERDCIYQEAEECIKQKKDDPVLIQKEVADLRKKGYPEHNGLFETNVIFRKHQSRLVGLVMRDWWKMITQFSRRDQLSFNYALWKHNASCIKLFPDNIRLMDGFLLKNHNPRVTSVLFVDTGKGFEKQHVLQNNTIIPNHVFMMKFDLSTFPNVKQLKFIISPNQFCLLKIDRITCHAPKESVKVKRAEIHFDPQATLLENGFIDFPDSNPELFFPVIPETKSVVIEGQVRFYDIENRFFELQQALAKIKSSKAYKLWSVTKRMELLFSKTSKNIKLPRKTDITSVAKYGLILQEELDQIINSSFYKLWQGFNEAKKTLIR